MKYDWRKSFKKFLIIGAYTLVVGAITVLTENHYWLFLIPALEALRNFLKHKLNWKL